MIEIVLDGTGPIKAALVERMYEYCALSGAQFERTPEEMTAGLRDLNDIAAELLADGIDLGYDLPTYADGLLEEPSGLKPGDAPAVVLLAAQRRMASLGGQLSPDLRASLNRSYNSLRSRYATVAIPAAHGGPWGTGYKRRIPRTLASE